jgi:hypothetical protein
LNFKNVLFTYAAMKEPVWLDEAVIEKLRYPERVPSADVATTTNKYVLPDVMAPACTSKVEEVVLLT